MKSVALIVAILMVSCITAMAAGPRNITSLEAKSMLDKNRNILLLDVRTHEEYRQVRIPGEVLIPISEFERRAGEVPANRPIIVFCAVGSRSRPVAQFLARKGYREVYNMTDGIFGWQRNGFPIQK